MDSKLTKKLHVGKTRSTVYPIDNMEKQKEDVTQNNRHVIQFPSLAFGSQGLQFNIPNNALQKGFIVSMGFPAGTVGAACAYNVIQRISYQFSGSTPLDQSGVDNFLAVCNDCETMTKRNEVIALGGGAADSNVLAATTIYHAWINLPWSRINASRKKFPYDSTQSNQPLTVTIYLNPVSRVYSTGTPTALISAEARLLQLDFADREHRVQLSGGKYMTWPFTYQQSFQSQTFTPASTSEQQIVNLTGFRKGDLKSILIYCMTDTNAASTKLFDTEELKDVSLLFNGQYIFSGTDVSHKLMALELSTEPNYVTIHSGNQPYIEVPVSQFLPKMNNSGRHWQHGINLSSQTLQLQFKSATASASKIYCVYQYNAVVVQDGQNTEVTF